MDIEFSNGQKPRNLRVSDLEPGDVFTMDSLNRNDQVFLVVKREGSTRNNSYAKTIVNLTANRRVSPSSRLLTERVTMVKARLVVEELS